MNNTDYNAANFNRGRYTINAIKKIATIVVAIFFVLGCTFVPGSAIVEEGHAAQKDAGYVQGEVIVCYVDTNDMNLTAKQEKKSEKLLGDSEELMSVEEVCIDDVDISNSKLDKEIQKEQVVDETLAVVSSDEKTTDELVSEIEKLPNVDFVEPNYIVKLTEGEEGEAVSQEESSQEESGIQDGENVEAVEGEAVETDVEEVEPDADSAEGDGAVDFTANQWAYYNGNNASEYRMYIDQWNGTPENPDGRVVAVLDSGVDYNHPDLNDVIWNKGNEYPELIALGGGKYGINTYGRNSRDPMDKLGHGTHCAGIIAAEWGNGGVAGAVTGVEIMPVRASSAEGLLSFTDIIEGFNYIKTAKQCGVNIVAINCSWSNRVTSAESINLAVTQAGEQGIVSVFASGNDSRNTDTRYYKFENGAKVYYEYLAWFLKGNPYKVVVNAINREGKKASYSNYGATTTDVAAPGTKIASTVIHGGESPDDISYYSEDYQYKDGTSMAAPAVSGEVAILAKKFPNEPADVLASMVVGNTRPDSEISKNCVSNGTACVEKALQADLTDFKYRHFKLESSEFTYNGAVQKPKVVEVNNKLTEGNEFNVSSPESADAGTYKVTVSPGNGFSGSAKEITYSINKTVPKVSLRSGGYIYDGGVKSNAVTVKGADGSTWANGNQYSLSGTLSAKMPGTYSVKVTPTDTTNYDAVTKNYSISVRPTAIKSLSGAKKAFKVKACKQPKKMVNGYQVRYSLYSNMAGAKTKTIGTKYNRISKKVSKLAKKKTYYVQVRTYKTINKKKYYSVWSAVRSVKTR